MKVLTLNTWNEEGPWRKRWDLIFSGITEFCPDIIGFQEIFKEDWAKAVGRQAGYKEVIVAGNSSGLVILTNYPVQRAQAFVLKSKSLLENYIRSVLCVEIEKAGHPFLVANTHLSWHLEDGDSRRNQLREIINVIRDFAPGLPVLALGDFNATPDSAEMNCWKREGNFEDTFARLHPGATGLTWDNRNVFTATHGLPDRRLDYIFTKNTDKRLGRLTESRVVFNRPAADGTYASDHYGLLTAWE